LKFLGTALAIGITRRRTKAQSDDSKLLGKIPGRRRAKEEKEYPMAIPETLSMTRRCFFAAAGMAVAAPVAVGAREPSPNTDDLPQATLLGDGDVKTYLLVFRSDQEVMRGLLGFAKKHKLVAGHLTGIGAISDAVIGYFDPRKKTYLRNHEKGQAELLSLTGNLAVYDNEPFFHVHVALGLRDGSARGGHLFEATVRPTVELVLTTYPKTVQRKIDAETGLPLLGS
jgi:predicted DNA-binding protein with PD1-like motif